MSLDFEFDYENNELYLIYEPYQVERLQAKLGIAWDPEGRLVKYTEDILPEKLKNLRTIKNVSFEAVIKKVFYLKQEDMSESLSRPSRVMAFKIGSLETLDKCEYLRIPGRILDCRQDIFLSTELELALKLFAVGYERRTSVFKTISKQISESEERIIVGGNSQSAIPAGQFRRLLAEFPTTALLKHYGELQIDEIISEYLTPKEDYHKLFNASQKRINRISDSLSPLAESTSPSIGRNPRIGTVKINVLRQQSLLEVRKILDEKLKNNLNLPESFWQEIVLSILPAIFPQYIAVLREAVIPESISIEDKVTSRSIDHLLVDASGNVDILEVKRPFGREKLLMKKPYRDNFIPARELTGGISQIEKYLYYLRQLGTKGESQFSDKSKEKLVKAGFPLPDNFKLKSLNSHGILLIGYCELTAREQRDFDLIRRQYSNVVDVITYNDLMSRLDRVIEISGDFSTPCQPSELDS